MDLTRWSGDSKTETVARFGPFEFCCQTGELRKNGVKARLQGKPAQLLRALIEHHGKVVTRDELKETLWASDIFVDFESGLNTAANRLRIALGDSAESPKYIETLPKLGYRFFAPVAFAYSTDDCASDLAAPLKSESVELTPFPTPPVPQLLAPVPTEIAVRAGNGNVLWPLVLATVGCALLGFALFLHLNARGSAPSFAQMTFSRGFITGARFASDGKTLVYSASWSGGPSRVFLRKPASSEPEAIGEGPAWIAGVSANGKAAIFRHSQHDHRFILESSPLLGGPATFVSDRARSADWGPNGTLCLVLANPAGDSLNYPQNRPLYSSSGWISNPRVSPDGRQIAFLEHPLLSDDAGQVVLLDTASGVAHALSPGWASVVGLAWHPAKREIWFTAARAGTNRMLMAVDLKGKVRQIAQMPGGMVLQDISAAGNVLIARTNPRMAMFYGSSDKGSIEDISLLDWSRAVALTTDGKRLLFDESGEGGGRQYSVYLYNTVARKTERLAEGRAMDLSVDGRWALTQAAANPGKLTLISLNSRKSYPVTTDGFTYQWAKFLPDSDCPVILLGASRTGQPFKIYRQQLPGGHPQPIAGEADLSDVIVNDQGNTIAGIDAQSRLSVVDLETGAIRTFSLPNYVSPARFTPENQVLTSRYENGSIVFETINSTSGETHPYRRFDVKDNMGTGEIARVQMSKDMKEFVYSRIQTLSDLFDVSGWN